MRKNIYRAKNVKYVNKEKLHEAVKDKRIIFGHDVGKERMCAVLMESDATVLLTIKWTHPEETSELLDLLHSLPVSRLEVAMEPSGTYGDSIRYQFHQASFPVYRVGTKRSHDYREVYDGVPSSHDAKSAALIAKLHLEGISELWRNKSEEEQALSSQMSILSIYEETYYRTLNRLEAILARHWPEVTRHLDLTTVSLLELLLEFRSPQVVALFPDKAKKLLRRVGRSMLEQDKIEGVVASAATTLGRPPGKVESDHIHTIVSEARRAYAEANKAKRKLERMVQSHPAAGEMSKTVGKITAAVLVAEGGDPSDYSSASAYEKAFGLNMKERSSGNYKGQLKITKRGPSASRRYLWFAVLRLIKDDIIFKKWYERKVQRDGGEKGRALVAHMRKLIKALWYVGQGNPFDSRILFDVQRLNSTPTDTIYD